MFVGGNWKLNGNKKQALALAKAVAEQTTACADVDIVVFPPFVYLDQVSQALTDSAIAVGGQNQADQEQGAFTGEIAASMLTDVGCQYVLLGHSERRHVYGESNELIAEKMRLALAHGLRPVLCVGETKEQRDANETDDIVLKQISTAINDIAESDLRQLVIAYEPVWAIGTGEVATPEQAQTVHAKIRAYLAGVNSDIAKKMPIIYGGSLKPENAAEIFAKPDVDGGLIGGASLKAEQFAAICEAAQAAD